MNSYTFMFSDVEEGEEVVNRRKKGISSLLKCTSAIRQWAYDINADFLDEYLQMSETLDHFCSSVMKILGPEYLRKPTMTDVENLYRHYEEKHGFRGC
ncbi:hypothetical protein Tco_0881708 [Tanacetum coccineum]